MNTIPEQINDGAEKQPLNVHFSKPNAPDRAELEKFVSDHFERVYGAKITHFMPYLMSLRDQNGKLMAVCGLRSAEDELLFLETYLDQPIESRLSARMGYTIRRNEIVEVGNFVVAEAGEARALVGEIIQQLHATSKQWAVFTIVPMISNAFVKMGIKAEVLGEAKKDRIPLAEQASWGTYYDQKPQIMAVGRS